MRRAGRRVRPRLRSRHRVDSENYRWFGQRYGDRFVYLDRIVIDDRYRRRGLASAVYDVVERDAEGAGRLVLEVNLDPPNDASLAFHRARGYEEVGTRGEPGHRVVLLARTVSAERTKNGRRGDPDVT